MALSSADTSRATSDELKKQLMEETSKLAEASSEEEVAESEEMVEIETPEEESTEEKTAEAETTEEKPPKREDTHKIVVEGKEEELTLDKLKEYAQKGRYLERERAKDKAEREKLKTETGQRDFQLPSDTTKINEQFVESLQKDTFGTMVQFYKTARDFEKQQEKAERKIDTDFETDKRELPHFGEVKSSYQEFRERGYDRETAWAMAERDFWMDYAFKAKEKGLNEGSRKTKLQQKAQIAVGEKKMKKEGSLPSPDEAKKLSSDQISKHLRRTKGDW